QQASSNGRIFASPLAKKMAQEKGIDLKSVKGSGDNGRITRSDIENYKPQAQPASQPQPAAIPQAAPAPVRAAQPATTDFEEVPVSQMRKTIARRLAESMFTAPHFYLTMTIDMDAAVAARVRI